MQHDGFERHGQDVAVVGLACRLPGAVDPSAFWDLLVRGEQQVRRQDDGTWRAALDDVAGFDAAFFGMDEAEAAHTDPQHRLLLELGWEALEHAGIRPDTLRGSETGVYVGIASDEYRSLLARSDDDSTYRATGGHRALAANRLSYVLGTRGPSLTLDSAQSSSLVAVHLASEALRSGEASAALVGGVSLVLTAESTRALDLMGALSPDGRCHTFDARANGFVRGEGGVVMVLKTLEAARRDGDRVHAVLRGSAVNNDGAGLHLTTPDPEAQKAVMRTAHRRAAVEAASIDYVELHGTGTPVGDPVEAAALGSVVGSGSHRGGPLAVGSVKTNVGHLEGAAGITGLLKTVLSVREGWIPPQVGFERPHPDIPLADLGLDVVAEGRAWPERGDGGPRRAGVSSFGMGGTNAHVVVEQAPVVDAGADGEGAAAGGALRVSAGVWPVPWSARSAAGVAEGAGRLERWLDAVGDVSVAGVGASLASRAVFGSRAVVVAGDLHTLAEGARSVAGGAPGAAAVVTPASGPVAAGGGVVLVFAGQGGQWVGMGARLLSESDVFADSIDDCARALQGLVEWDLADVIRSGDGLDRVEVVQPVAWAVMVSLARMWVAAGVQVDGVVGHSQGELAAAVLSGGLSLEAAAAVVVARSRVIAEGLSGAGVMASVTEPVERVREALVDVDGVEVAVVNGPSQVVVSGQVEAVTAWVERVAADGWRAKVIGVDYASHSSVVDRVADELTETLTAALAEAGTTGGEPWALDVSMWSSVGAVHESAGTALATVTADDLSQAAYWVQNLRSAVEFGAVVDALIGEGRRAFVEVGAHPVLSQAIEQVAENLDTPVVTAASMRRDDGGINRWWTELGRVWVSGVDVDWTRLLPTADRLDVPTYPFQRRQLWIGASPEVEEPHEVQRDAPTPAPDERRPTTGPLAGLTGEDLRDQALELVMRTARDVLAVDELPGSSTTFKELGLESARGVELRNRLAAATGLSLRSGLVYDQPTPERVAALLVRELEGADEDAAPTVPPRPARDDADPVVISGMSVRLPGGVSSPDELWELLVSEGDAIGGFPTDRGWDLEALYDPEPGKAGRTYVREGGFLADVGSFDAEFFGISPREAVAMDPQQRLVLESAWEAFEHAGYDASGLRGSRTGVYVGVMAQEYGARLGDREDDTTGQRLTGSSGSVVSGRVAFALGLEGPAVTVDTACSSSLVALHQAVQAVRLGECDRAIAGGVTVMSSPGLFLEFSRQRGLSADGRCRSFSDDASGTGWAEGVALVVVERLSDAVAAGRRVWGVVAGSAINQDGASNGLTAPSGPAQERVIGAALGAAGLAAGEVDVVEAHGTGTRLGDPIEADALLATYGQGRGGEPLLLGSLKSNVGHTQAAAGVAGVVKVLLGMDRGYVPASLHVGTPSTHVDWDAGAVEVVAQGRDWPERADGGPRRAGVSSFGVSGTNAHVVVEQAPVVDPVVDGEGERAASGGALRVSADVWPVPWSARSAAGVADGAGRLERWVRASDDVAVAGMGASLASRAAFGSRAVVVADGSEALAAGLGSVASGAPGAGVVVTPTSGAVAAGAGVVLVFAGQGGQWVGMGARLLAESGVFADSIDDCARALQGLVEWDLADVVRSGEGLDRVEVVQPVAWAVMVSLARMWVAAGVQVDGVVGHSQGELAAAVVSGGLSLESAAAVVVARSRVIAEGLSGAGVMASVTEPVERVREALVDVDGVEVAVVNGPSQVVVSGQVDAVTAWVEQKAAEGWRAKVIGVDYASHSSVVDQVADELTETLTAALADVATTAAESWALDVPMWSSVGAVQSEAGTALATVEVDQLARAEYWVQNLRSAVEFGAVVDALITDGRRAFVEVGAHPVLSQAIEQVAENLDTPVVTAASMRRDDGGIDRWWTELGRVWVAGVDVDWTRLLPATDRLDVPTYPFQRRHYWTTAPAPAAPEPDRDDGLPGRYSQAWRSLRLDQGPSSDAPVLLAVPVAGERALVDDATVRCLEAGFARAGSTCAVLSVDLDDSRAGVSAALAAAAHDHVGARLVNLVGLADDVRALGATVRLLQSAVEDDAVARVWALTQDVHQQGTTPPPVAGAETWGLGRVVALEHPDVWGGLLDLPARLDDRVADRVVEAVQQHAHDELAVRGGALVERRVVRAPALSAEPWTPRGTVLVTGAAGAIGRRLAVRLAHDGADRLVLLGRRDASDPQVVEVVQAVEAAGAEAVHVSCDVADRDAVARVLDEHRPDAVFHAAGVLDDALLLDVDDTSLHRVLGAKLDGARHLDELTREADLDAFVLFSSFTGAWGNPGQGAYAAANAGLDAIARGRRLAGATATSVAWGLWGGGGMAEGAGETALRRRGLEPMDPDAAIECLLRVVAGASPEPCVTVLDLDWPRFLTSTAAARPAPAFAELAPARDTEAEGPAAEEADGPGRWSGLSEDEVARQVEEAVRRETATVLQEPDPAALDPDRAFRSLGVDSLLAMELRNRLNHALDVSIPSTAVFDHPTVTELARLVRAALPVPTADAGADTAPDHAATAARPVDDDPIVISGMSVRLPGGVTTPEALWELLVAEGDAIGGFPTDRGWDLEGLYDPEPGVPGRTYAREGGFVTEAGLFDAEFFGISPREAVAMDPQQRLVLESAWEAFEHAGIDPASLRRTRTGVFVGMTHQEYATRMHEAPEHLEGYLLTGKSASVVSGRVAYALGLEGPAVTVDTACSSSLVALHQAVQSVRLGECDRALAGGVTIMSSPGLFVEFSRQRGLSADGRCRSFSDDADGTGWAEGVALVVVERLSDAVAAGRRVWGVVAGSATNQDGASNGLTAPSGPAQERVIGAALASAGVSPTEVDVVEAHGTGTRLGDPIEAHALLATYGRDRAGEPLLLGSLKSNVGHTQAAAGMAGVVKVLLGMDRGFVPASLHVGTPSTHVDWESGAVEVVAHGRDWPARADGGPRRAGVSAFGVSGTNAHVIIEQPPASRPSDPEPVGNVLGVSADTWPVAWSARTAGGVADGAGRLGRWLDTAADGASVADVASSLASRTAFGARAVVVAGDLPSLAAGTGSVASATPSAGVVVTPSSGPVAASGGVVLVFAGQGGQWVGMGARLLEESTVFADSIAACGEVLAPLVEWDLAEVIGSGDGLDKVEVVQPVAWAVMVSLARMWVAAGVQVDGVVGHSQGELAAAVISGGLSLEAAAAVVVARSRVIGTGLSGAGVMASVTEPVERVREALVDVDGVEVAVVNGPSQVVVSGQVDAVTTWVEQKAADGWRAKVIGVDYASHSSVVDQVADELTETLTGALAAAGTTAAESWALDVPMWSSVGAVQSEAGTALATVEADQLARAEYWVQNLRSAVEFGAVVDALISDGRRAFVEVGAHPVLSQAIEQVAENLDTPVVTAASMRRDDGGIDRWWTELGRVWVAGVDVDWTRLLPATDRLDVPTYPFQHEHYWTTTSPPGIGDRGAERFGMQWQEHPFVRGAEAVAGTSLELFSGSIARGEHGWLREHAVAGTSLLPGTALVELVLHAGRAVGAPVVAELTLESAVLLEAGRPRLVQVSVEGPDATGARQVQVHTRGDEQEWTRHVSATVVEDAVPTDPVAWASSWPPAGDEVPADELYGTFAALGYEYGPSFHGVRRAWRTDDAVHAEVELDTGTSVDASTFGIHPALLDAALQPWLLTRGVEVPEGGAALPFSWEDVTLSATGSTRLRVRVAVTDRDTVSLEAADADGRPVVAVRTLRFTPVGPDRLRALSAGPSPTLHRIGWTRTDGAPDPGPEPWWLVPAGTSEPSGLRGRLLHDLDAVVEALADPSTTAPETVVLVVPASPTGGGESSPAAWTRVVADVLAVLRRWTSIEGAPPLVVATRGGLAVDASVDQLLDVGHAGVAGLVRSARSENPHLVALLDLDALDHAAVVAALPRALDVGEVAVRRGEVLVPRLERTGPVGPVPGQPFGAGTVIVTGATGTLGRLVARHLVERHDVAHLLLLSRSGGDSAGAPEQVDELRGLGADVHLVACDVADEEQLAAVLADHSGPAVTGVVHAAGVLDDATVDSLDATRLATVVRPKVEALHALLEVLDTSRLERVVAFSGAAGLLGRPGQANYAAANTMLDAYVRLHHDRLPLVSVAWGLWEQATGMTEHLSATDLQRMRRSGIAPMAAEEGLALLDAAVAASGNEPVVAALRLDVASLRREERESGIGSVHPLVRHLVARATRETSTDGGAGPSTPAAERPASPAEALRTQDAESRRRELDVVVRRTVAAILGLDGPRAVRGSRPFKDLGFDSLMVVELRNQLREATALAVTAAMVFDHPSPGELTAHLDTLLAAELGDDAAPDPEPGPEPRSEHESGEGASGGDGHSGTGDDADASGAPGPDLDDVSDDDLFDFIEEQL